jgi:hypothetical protein
MANFATHIKVASGLSFIGSLGVYTFGITTIPQTIFLILLGSLGGIMPDIDSPHSTSIGWVFTILGMIAAFITIFSCLASLGVLLSLFIGFIIFKLVQINIKAIVSNHCKHRGVIHSIPVGITIGLLVSIVTNILTQQATFAWVSGFFISFGYFIHLTLDEIYSVDLKGARLKKSFGTALSLFSRKNMIGYLIVYAALVMCFYFVPPYDSSSIVESIKLAHGVGHHLFPSDFYI